MTRLFTMAVLAAATAVWGDPPTEQAIQEITDLRSEVGPATADGPEFAEALRAQFAQAFQAPPQAWANDRYPELPAPPVPPAPPAPGDGWNHGGPPAPNTFVPGPTPPDSAPPRLQVSGQDIFMPVRPGAHPMAPPPPPGPPHERPRDLKNLLRRSAAELDRLANELEVAELYAESDALREAAGRLRRSARAAKGPGGMAPPPPPPQGPPPRGPHAGLAPPPPHGGPPHPPRPDRHAGPPQPGPTMPGPAEAPPAAQLEHLKARVKNAMADASRRQAELESQLAEAKAKLSQMESRAKAAAEQARRGQEEARRQLERHERELRRRMEERERRFRDRGRDEEDEADEEGGDGETRLRLPPRGIYGGPTEPEGVLADLLPLPVE